MRMLLVFICKKMALVFIIPSLVVCSWIAASMFNLVPEVLLPSPWSTFDELVSLASSGELQRHASASLFRTICGFGLACSIGIPLGFLCAASRSVSRLVHVPCEMLRLTPPLALVPLLILWFGINEAPKIAVVFLSGFFPIFLNVYTSASSIDPKFKELAAMLGLNWIQKLLKIYMSSCAPGIFAGLRLGFGYCWRALVGAELIAASSGLGHLISESGELLKTDAVFVGIICIAFMGMAMDRLLSAASSKFNRWG